MIARKKITILLLTLLSLGLFLWNSVNLSQVSAETEEERMQRLTSEIEQYENEIGRLKSEATTLSNQIAQYDAQIYLTALKIAQTEEKISLLGGRIDQLETSLNSLSNAFQSRVVRTYKMSRVKEPYLLLMLSSHLDSFVSSFHYLAKIQQSDHDLLLRLESAQSDYEVEKKDQEQLQDELESQRKVLGAQKAAKSNLLSQTKNDEKRFQELLAQARSEFEAIQAIIAGKGDEEEVRHVSQGETIASVIAGPSCNSSGEHLHFMVSAQETTQNPFNYLKGGIAFVNCSGTNCGSGDGDSFSPGGSWDWPINPEITFTQGYGSTWAIRNTWIGRIYSFHNGIDILSDSSRDVRAVQSGTLFRGSYTGYNGCRLRYVRVDHDDSNLNTFYLHINY